MTGKKIIDSTWMPPLCGVLSWIVSFSIVCWLWKMHGGMPMPNVDLRDLVLAFFTPIGIGLAVWRSMVASQQIKIGHQRIEISQQGLTQDRYQAAADMLASKSMAARVGGVHAMQKIAEENIENYHIQVMNVFLALIRHPRKKVANEIHDPKKSPSHFDNIGPAPDDVIKALVIIIMRDDRQKAQEKKHKKKEPWWHINLRGAYLARIRLNGTNLSNFDLSKANLAHAQLEKANLTGVKLHRTNLSETNLTNAIGITQTELNEAHYYIGFKPKLKGAMCAESGEQLEHEKMISTKYDPSSPPYSSKKKN